MSVQVKTPTKSNFSRVEIESFSSPESIRRSKDDSYVKCDPNLGPKFSQPWGRKRRYSQSGKREEGSLRRKRLKSSPCAGPLPNRFLNGGSIDDPLNLNGLDSSELGRQLNSVTPKSSPLPTPTRHQSVEVRIPFNITDPLNLNDDNEETDLEKLLRKKRTRNRHKKKDDAHIFSPTKHMDKGLMEALKIDVEPEQKTVDDDNLPKDTPKETQTQKSRQVSNRIVSPVIPQVSPKTNKGRRRTSSGSKSEPAQTVTQSQHNKPITTQSSIKNDKKSSPKKFKTPAKQAPKRTGSSSGQGCKKGIKFIYGNYSRYYGYRNPALDEDNRLKCFNRDWFEGRSILDIGCNVGHLTLALACDYHPSKIIGMDIDPKLIMVARKNIRYYMSSDKVTTSKFPVSNMLSYGPIEAPPLTKQEEKKAIFPHNVLFKQGNFVLENDELLDLQKEDYDVILALSVTKWVHFNWGDAGLKRFFKRVYKQLKPGGRFILEPQPWSSYKKKKKLTPEIHENFKKISLRPDQFTDYLLSREVGFSTCITLDVPFNASKGFRRPILMFRKSETIQNSPSSEAGSVSPSPFTAVISSAGGSIYSEDTSSSSSSSDSNDSFCTSCSSQVTPREQSAPHTPVALSDKGDDSNMMATESADGDLKSESELETGSELKSELKSMSIGKAGSDSNKDSIALDTESVKICLKFVSESKKVSSEVDLKGDASVGNVNSEFKIPHGKLKNDVKAGEDCGNGTREISQEGISEGNNKGKGVKGSDEVGKVGDGSDEVRKVMDSSDDVSKVMDSSDEVRGEVDIDSAEEKDEGSLPFEVTDDLEDSLDSKDETEK